MVSKATPSIRRRDFAQPSKTPIPSHNYVFDLTRRERGLVVAAKVAPSAGIVRPLPDCWQCSATSDADALQQAMNAAESVWPRLPRRTFNDFVVSFVSEDALAEGIMSRAQTCRANSRSASGQGISHRLCRSDLSFSRMPAAAAAENCRQLVLHTAMDSNLAARMEQAVQITTGEHCSPPLVHERL
jgi:hypothetical protein